MSAQDMPAAGLDLLVARARRELTELLLRRISVRVRGRYPRAAALRVDDDTEDGASLMAVLDSEGDPLLQGSRDAVDADTLAWSDDVVDDLADVIYADLAWYVGLARPATPWRMPLTVTTADGPYLPITPELMGLGRVMDDWKTAQTALADAARAYAVAIETETGALIGYAAAVARGELAGAGEVQAARDALAAALTARETAARALGASPPAVRVRARQRVLAAARQIAGVSTEQAVSP